MKVILTWKRCESEKRNDDKEKMMMMIKSLVKSKKGVN